MTKKDKEKHPTHSKSLWRRKKTKERAAETNTDISKCQHCFSLNENGLQIAVLSDLASHQASQFRVGDWVLVRFDENIYPDEITCDD